MTGERNVNAWGGCHGEKWLDAEIAALVQMRKAGHKWGYICEQLKRRKPACEVKYLSTMRATRYEASRDWAMLASKSEQRRTDLTGIICGDPAPGRSALESRPQSRPGISLAPVRMMASA